MPGRKVFSSCSKKRIRPSDLEAYVETFGSSSPLATSRADSLKSFLAYMNKQKILQERLVSHVRVRRQGMRARAELPRRGIGIT